MATRIINSAETDLLETIVTFGSLLQINFPGTLLSPAVFSMNGSAFTMTAGSFLTTTGSPNSNAAAGPIGLGLNGTISVNNATITAAGMTIIGNAANTPDEVGPGIGTVTLSGGGRVTDTWLVLGSAASDQGTLTLTGSGTVWKDDGDPVASANANYGGIVVGLGGTGTLQVLNGAALIERTYADIGSDGTSVSTATVNGAGSTWTIGTYAWIGNAGNGSLTVSNQGSVSTGTDISIAYQAGSQGTVTVDNATLNSTGQIIVGYSGNGSLNVRNGSTATATDVQVAYTAAVGVLGDLVVDNSTLTASGTLYAGVGGTGTVWINHGGTVNAQYAWVAAGTTGGTAALPSLITIDGVGSKLLVSQNAAVGVANALPSSGSFTNGLYGIWTYADSGIGNFAVSNAGYISVLKSLLLQASTDPDQPAALIVGSGGSAEIGGNNGPIANTLTVDSGAQIVGHGTIDVGNIVSGGFINGMLANSGMLIAQSGTLKINANVTGSGTVKISQNSVFEINGNFAGTVTFDGGYASTLRLDNPNPVSFQGAIDNLVVGDTIALLQTGLPASISHTNIIGGSTLYVTFENGTVWTYNLSGDYSGKTFAIRETKENGNKYDDLTLQVANPKIETGVSGTPTFGTANYSPYIDSLVWGWGAWKPAAGKITYWFGGQNDVAESVSLHGATEYLSNTDTVHTWTDLEKSTYEYALSKYASVSGLSFIRAASAATADIVAWLAPKIAPPGDTTLGISEIPGMVTGGPIWQYYNDQPWVDEPNQLSFGGDGRNTIIHELGHALGLAHPHDGGYEPDGTLFPGVTKVDDLGTYEQNQAIYTVMSYNDGWDGASPPPLTKTYGTQGGLGALDIGALQLLYGANNGTGAGNSTYQLPTTNAPGTGWNCIWDPNGINTISNAGSSMACVIDLREATLSGPGAGGYASYLPGTLGGYTIANGTLLNDAIGGAGDDRFITNSSSDTITGDTGNDTVVFENPLASYTLHRVGSTITANIGGVTDTLLGIEVLEFSDQTISASDVTCFVAGTCIATPNGDIAIEILRIGDTVLGQVDADVVPMPVKWVGRRRIDLTRHPQPEFARPILIRADAVAPGQPARDLWLSPDHALYLDGRLIPVRQLVNGGSIVQDDSRSSVDYFHIELDRHAIIRAEGLQAESFLDSGNRDWFENSGPCTTLHPLFVPASPSKAAAPRADDKQVELIWNRLAVRSRELGMRLPTTPAMTAEPELLMITGDGILKPSFNQDGRLLFALPRPFSSVRLISRASRPSCGRPWLDDRRQLGVQLRRILCDDGWVQHEIPMDHPALEHGWWNVERAGTTLTRWTNGAGTLRLPANTRTVEIQLQGEMHYPVEGVAFGTMRRAS